MGPAAAIKNLKDKKESSSDEEEKAVKTKERPAFVRKVPLRRYSMNSEKMLTAITSRLKECGDQKLN